MTPPKLPTWLRSLLPLACAALGACETPAPPCQPRPHVVDADGDGFGDELRPAAVCAGLPGFVLVGGDCDDADAARAPGAAEVCDGLDNDCDGAIDEDTPTLARRYRDIDLDGFGSARTSVVSCAPVEGYVDNPADCNDIAVSVFPGAEEVCDWLDNDCDGQIDEGNTSRPWFVDADGDGVGSEAMRVESCRPPEGFVAEAGDCDDSDPARSPRLEERCDDGIDNDCDGAASRCELRGLYALADEEHVILPNDSDGRFGWSMDCRGDVNHDGLDDVIIGQPEARSVQGARGRVVFLRGPIQGRTSAALEGSWFTPPLDPPRSTGSAVAFVQDIDGDHGAEAILQGAYLIASPLPATGRASPTASIGAPDALGQDGFGSLLASLGDINADRRGDFAVLSAQHTTDQGVQAPVIDLFLGEAAHDYSATGASRLVLPRTEAAERLSLAGTPDLTGDGQPDLLVGAPKSDLGGELSGLVYVAASPLGTRPEAALTESSFRLRGHEPGAQAGFSVADAGDVNGDGFRDLLVGAPFAREGSTARGAAYLIHGPITAHMSLDAAHTRLIGAGPGDQAGWAVAGAGDVNGDGFDDVLVSAPLNGLNGREAGAVYLLYGPLPSGRVALSQADAIFVGGESAGGGVGSALVGMCDLNGDGRADFMISSTGSSLGASAGGAVWVIYGRGR